MLNSIIHFTAKDNRKAEAGEDIRSFDAWQRDSQVEESQSNQLRGTFIMNLKDRDPKSYLKELVTFNQEDCSMHYRGRRH